MPQLQHAEGAATGMLVTRAEVAGVDDPVQRLRNARIVGMRLSVGEHLIPQVVCLDWPWWDRLRLEGLRVVFPFLSVATLDEKSPFQVSPGLQPLDEGRQV